MLPGQFAKILDALNGRHADLMIEHIDQAVHETDLIDRIRTLNAQEAKQLREKMMLRKSASGANQMTALRDREISPQLYILDGTNEIDLSIQEEFYFLVFMSEISEQMQKIGDIIMRINYLDTVFEKNPPRVYFVSRDTNNSVGDKSSFFFIEDPDQKLWHDCGIDLIKISSGDPSLVKSYDDIPTVFFCHGNKIVLGGKGDFIKFVDLAHKAVITEKEEAKSDAASKSSGSTKSTSSAGSHYSFHGESHESPEAEVKDKDSLDKKKKGVLRR